MRLRLATRPADAPWRVLAAANRLRGIGFTTGFFVAARAFTEPELLATAKVAVTLASLTAAAFGWLVLARAVRPARRAV